MKEIWKDIEGFEGLYQVSNLGNVKSLNYWGKNIEHLLKITVNKNGYCKVCLAKSDKHMQFYVHRLVAKAFIPNPSNYLEVNHINEIKSDCRAENLEWCDRYYNTHYNDLQNRISKNRIKVMGQMIRCIETGQIFTSIIQASKFLNHNPNNHNLNQALKHGWKCGGYHWEYVNKQD